MVTSDRPCWSHVRAALTGLHLFRLVDVTDGRHLAVFVRSEYLAHGARGHAVGDAVNVDLLPLVSVARGRLLLPFRRGLAAAEVMGGRGGNQPSQHLWRRGCTLWRMLMRLLMSL